MAVLLGGPASSPRILEKVRVDLADPSIPESIHPFHPALEKPAAEGKRMTGRLVRVVEERAARSLADLFTRWREAGRVLGGAGLVVGSLADPEAIANDHIRAHASEGRLFRRVVEEAAGRCRLPAIVLVEKEVYASAAEALGAPEARLKEAVAALGKGLAGPWRAVEKTAALAAWIVLARAGRGRAAGASRPR
jgi:hypothetical protein